MINLFINEDKLYYTHRTFVYYMLILCHNALKIKLGGGRQTVHLLFLSSVSIFQMLLIKL